MTANNDGWIEWKGGECPVDGYIKVDVKLRNGDGDGGDSAHFYSWDHDGAVDDIIAYRLHQSEPQCCESVMRAILDQPTIESLAADYRAKLAIYEQAQEELNAHRCGVEAAWTRLELAGKEIGLQVMPI